MPEPSIQDELLRIAIDQSSEGIALVDLEGYVMFLNRAFAEMHGYSTEELIGKHLSIFHTTDQMSEVSAANEQAKVTGRFHGEIAHVKKNGEVFPTIMQNTLLHNENGSPFAILGTMQDISVIKEAREEIRVREQRIRDIIDLVPHQIFIKNRDGLILLVNRAVAVAYGTTVEEMTGKNHREIHHNTEEIDMYSNEDRQVIDDNQKIHIPKQPFTHADGSVHWLETIKVPIDFTCKEKCVLGVALDITDRVRIEDALRESEERYKSLAEIAFNGILIHDKGIILYANQQLADMFGYIPEDYIGQTLLNFVLPESLPLVIEKIQNPGPDIIEVIGVRKDGSLVDMEIIAADCIYLDHKARVCAIKDVTQQREMENELQKAKDSAMLYLDLMCHDMRNQLQIMLGYTTLVEETEIASDTKHVLDNIERSINRCDSIIQKVNVTEEIIALPLISFDLDKSVRTVVDTIRSTYPAAIVDLKIDVDSAIINGNRLLDSVISNILENAIEHNNNDTKHVWVELKALNSGFSLVISDNGSGIDDNRKIHLLDIRRRYGGVGLHLVKRITEKMNGTIIIKDRLPDNPTSGAKFVLWFPEIPNE